jgi:hypothetical protein
VFPRKRAAIRRSSALRRAPEKSASTCSSTLTWPTIDEILLGLSDGTPAGRPLTRAPLPWARYHLCCRPMGPQQQDLRTAGGAVVHPVWQQAHLGVAAFAGMLAQDLGQGDYPLEKQQHLGVEDVSTPSAARKPAP